MTEYFDDGRSRPHCRIPAAIQAVGTLHGFCAAFSCVLCLTLVPSALFTLQGLFAFGIWLAVAVACLLIRAGVLRAVRLSFVGAVIVDVAGALMFPCIILNRLFSGDEIAIELFLVPPLVSFVAVLSLIKLQGGEARKWFFCQFHTQSSSR